MKRNSAAARTEDSGVHRLTAPRPVRAPRAPRKLGVGDQVRVALRPKNRLEALCGLILGGFVPLATFWTAHHELASWTSLSALMVLGGLLFSARTVFVWAKLAFDEPVKAFGFVLLLELVMTASKTGWLSATALALLIAINGVATGCQLARKS